MTNLTPSTDFLAQHAALTRGAGFSLLSDRTLLAVTGADRVTFLHAFCTNDIKKLSPGRGCEAFITSPQGKTLGHVYVFCEPNQLVIDTAPGQAKPLIEHFDRYVISEDVQFVDRAGDLCDLLVAGTESAALLSKLSGSRPPAALLDHQPAEMAGLPVVIRRVEYTWPVSFFVQVAASDASKLMHALAEDGAVRCEANAVEATRLEAGVPIFGQDISVENLPQEVGRDAQAISFTKGCYLGQETVARIDALGHVNRRLAGLRIEGEALPTTGDAITAGGQDVGQFTSAGWSPVLGATLALAYVRRIHARPGTLLQTTTGQAEVISLPVASR